MLKITMGIALIFILSACKGGAGNKTDSEDKKLLTGYYIDSPVIGLEYDCNTNKGKTDSDGKFQFEAGESCTFYLGNKAMRSIDKDKLFNGVKIFEKNLKIASILQTLDADGNASNGIEIPSGADICMDKSIHDTNVSQLHSCLKKSILEYSGTEVNETKAKEHLENTEKKYNPTTNITIMENNSINITLSDKNINSDNLTYVITKNPSHGKLTGIAPNLTYTPSLNFSGSDSFSYRVNDGVVQNVAIRVANVNNTPIPTFTTLTTQENKIKRGVITATDDDNDTLIFIMTTKPRNGTLSLEPNGSFVYTPNPNFNGNDSFVYKVNDGTVDSIEQNVIVTVTAINHRPIPTFTKLTVQEDTTKIATLTAIDDDNDTLTFSVIVQPQNGILSLEKNGNFSYTPNHNFNGNDSFTYKVSDETDDSVVQNVTITVTAINDRPVPTFAALTVQAGRIKKATLTATDDDSDTLAFSIVTQPQNGRLILDENGSFSYTPNPNFSGSDSFSYIVNDGTLDSVVQNVTITVTSVNYPQIPNDTNIHITEDYKVIPLDNNRTIYKKIYLESSAKNLYLVFSNTNEANSSQVTLKHSNKVAMQKNYLSKSIIKNSSKIKPAPAHVTYFNNHALEHIKSKKNINKNIITTPKSFSKLPSVGDVNTFYLEQDLSVEINATLKKVVSKVKTKFGEKTLNIWVSDNSFKKANGCKKETCLTQDMIDDLANNFLKIGDNNDIYDWVTNIYGEEWGSEPSNTYTNFIEQNNTIDILLFDIDNDDNPNGGTVGYFYAKDNFKSSDINGSNERVMFYVDSVLFANSLLNGFWQRAVYSTLAHEFQHMIHFYQKNLIALNDGLSETWLNEMMSVTTEYLIATKLEYSGDRGVAYNDGSAGRKGNSDGRFPYFNDKNTITVTNWSSNIYDYAKVASFGAFLVNNYGGASLLNNMMINRYGDEQTVIDAIKSTKGVDITFGELLQKWGIAIMLSDHDNLDDDTPKYNTGDFTINSYGGINYEMGSINFFNYNPKPTIFSADKNITINPHANYYYKIGENISSNFVELNITLDANTKAVLIAK